MSRHRVFSIATFVVFASLLALSVATVARLRHVPGAATSLSSPVCLDPTSSPYLAAGDGTTDDTVALTSALSDAVLNAVPVCLGPRAYLVSSIPTIQGPIVIRGDGPALTSLVTSSSTLDVLTFRKSADVSGLAITSSVPRTAGTYLTFLSGANDSRLDNFALRGAFWGVLVQTGATMNVSNGSIRGTAAHGVGIVLDGGNDHYVDRVTMDADPTQMPMAGVWQKSGGATIVSRCDIIHHGFDLLLNGGSLWSHHNYYDTATRGWYVQASIAPIVRVFSDHDWMCNHTGNGVLLVPGPFPIGALDFRDAEMQLNAVNGFASLLTGALGLRIHGGQFGGNGASGVMIAGGAERFSVSDAILGASPGMAGNGAYGLYVGDGAGNNFSLVNLDLNGNGAGGSYVGATGANRYVVGLMN